MNFVYDSIIMKKRLIKRRNGGIIHGKENIDWSNLGFAYMQTDMRYVSNYKTGHGTKGALTSDANIVLNE